MTSPLGVGIVGASINGGWGIESHLPAVQATPAVRLRAVSTSSYTSARITVAKYDIPRGYADATSLAADEGVDLVTVAVKVTDHATAVEAAVEAGKNVYCEWPLGVDAAQAISLRDRAVAHGVEHIIGLQARLQPALISLRERLAAGTIGRIVAVRAASTGMGHGAAQLPAGKAWVADRKNGLSVLSVRAAHTLDAIRFAVGDIVDLSAHVDVRRKSIGIIGQDHDIEKTSPDLVQISGHLTGDVGLSAFFALGVHATGAPLITVYGTDGTLEVLSDERDGQIQMSRLRLVEATARGARNVPLPSESAHRSLSAPAASVARMYAALAENPAALPNFDDAVSLHRLLASVELAAEEKRTVRIDK